MNRALALLLFVPAIVVCQSSQPAIFERVPEEVGIYAVLPSGLKEIPSETVEAHHAFMSFGLDGRIDGPHSSFRFSGPQQFFIRPPEGYSASEYRLLKLDEKKDRRQFRALTVHVGGATDNASNNALPFSVEKISNRTWRVRTDLPKGEYAFFSPQPHGGGLGKSLTYTFGIESVLAGQSPEVPTHPESPGSIETPAAPVSQVGSGTAPVGVRVGPSVEAGVEITGLSPDSPFQAAGLHVGNVIKAVDLKPVHTVQEFEGAVANGSSGGTIRISYMYLESGLWWVQREVVVNLRR